MLISAIMFLSLFTLGCTTFPIRDLSLEAKAIADCPSSPNCVSSQSESSTHKVEPLDFSGSLEDFKKLVFKIEKTLKRAQIQRLEGPYAHLVVTSQIFRFKDDLELYFEPAKSLIQVRSASRLGHSDLGVNKARISELKKILQPKKNPIVIGHRGASGFRPEHTLEAYQLAIEMGADFIEPDLVSTKDGILIARHENEISETTDAALKFPSRKTTKVVDGESISGWFSEDLTLSEIQSLRAVERLGFRDQKYNGQYQIPTFAEILELAKSESLKRGRPIGVYPELKHPSYFKNLNLPLDEKLTQALKAADLSPQQNPIYIQSFELSVLKNLKKQVSHPLILLIGDLSKAPYGSDLTYRQLLTNEKLQELKSDLSGFGFHKSHAQEPDLFQRVQEHKYLIHVYTFRSDKSFLDSRYRNQPELEYLEYYQLGIDGVFTDFPDQAIKARSVFLN